MSCFWNSIINAVKLEEFKILDSNLIRKPNPKELAILLKKHSKICSNIQVNGDNISKKCLKELFSWIKEFNVNTVNSGTLVGTLDPFLTLICELLNVNIVHSYAGSLGSYKFNAKISYTNKNKTNRTLNFGSSASHFYNN